MVKYMIYQTQTSHLAFWKLRVHLLFIISPPWKLAHNITFCTLQNNDGTPQPVLCSLHPYCSQVQG